MGLGNESPRCDDVDREKETAEGIEEPQIEVKANCFKRGLGGLERFGGLGYEQEEITEGEQGREEVENDCSKGFG